MSSSEYARLSLLPAGWLTLPEHLFCDDQHDENLLLSVPSMSFLIQHPKGLNVVFDLGIRKVWQDYSQNIRSHVEKRRPIWTEPDVSESLLKGGLSPSSVDGVILSHVHWDHVGTPSDFTNAQFIVGHGTRHVLEHSMSYHSVANFEKDLLPSDRIIELPAPSRPLLKHEPLDDDSAFQPKKGLHVLVPGAETTWKTLSDLDNTMDLFGDGLIYIIDSPGHITGHLNLLVRVSESRWFYLAGDACHHQRILDGQSGIATWYENNMHVCIHVDQDKAVKTLGKIRATRSNGLDGWWVSRSGPGS